MSETHQGPQAGAILDIGGDVGALLLHTGPERDEQEIHVAPVDDPAHRTHTVVREHPLPHGRTMHAALFPALPAGDYLIIGENAASVTVQGGEVTEQRVH